MDPGKPKREDELLAFQKEKALESEQIFFEVEKEKESSEVSDEDTEFKVDGKGFGKRASWTEADQRNIFESFLKHGKCWKNISKDLNGRNQNSVRGYFYWTIRKFKEPRFKKFTQSFIDASTSNQPRKNQPNDKFFRKDLNPLGNFILNYLASSHSKEDERETHVRRTLVQMIENPENKKLGRLMETNSTREMRSVGSRRDLDFDANNVETRSNENLEKRKSSFGSLPGKQEKWLKTTSDQGRPRPPGMFQRDQMARDFQRNHQLEPIMSLGSQSPSEQSPNEEFNIRKEAEVPLKLVTMALELYSILSGPPSEAKENAFKELNDIRLHLYQNYRITLV